MTPDTPKPPAPAPSSDAERVAHTVEHMRAYFTPKAAPASAETLEQAETKMHMVVSERELRAFACEGPVEYGVMAENAADALKQGRELLADALRRLQERDALKTRAEALEAEACAWLEKLEAAEQRVLHLEQEKGRG